MSVVDSPSPSTAPASPGYQVSATVPDWSRERCTFGRWDPARRLLRSIRRYQKWKGRWGPIGFVIARWNVLAHRFWSAVSGADIPLNVSIAGGLALPHPTGVVIAPQAKVGPNCLIFQQATLGYGGPIPGFPTVGGHVDIGAGARLLGGIKIGDHAKIGANAVVLTDVPAGATAVGIPAKIRISPPVQVSDSQ